MKRIVIALLLLFPFHAFSQALVGKGKSFVRYALQRDLKKNPEINIVIDDKDSLILYSIRDEKYKPVDFIYRFDQSGKCVSQRVLAGCDSCFQKYLNALLERKKYEWKKINENQYVSKYSEFLMVELSPQKEDYSYIILKADWNRETYRLLMGN